MRFTLCMLAAGLALAVEATPASAFGRGGGFRGAAVGPAGGVRTGGFERGVATGPFGGVQAGNVHGGSYTGPGGGTIQHVGGGGVGVGPFGGVHAGSGGATRITGPGGNTYTTGHAGGVGVGPLGGVHAGGASGTAISGPGGAAAFGQRGGVTVGPWGVAAGGARGGMAIGPGGGVVAGGSRGGVIAGPYGGVAAGGVRVGAVGHYTGYVSPAAVRTTAFGVRGTVYPYFTPTWYRAHTAAWVAPRWVTGVAVGTALWAVPVWGTVSTFVGVTAPAVVYDYGSTVVIQDDTVYVNGDSVGTAGDYATQAITIADTGRATKPADTDEWQPLGVFGMIQGDEKVAQRIFQLAVNKDGLIRGNYYDAVADNTIPVFGALDKKSQRVAWSIGEKKDIVFETGLDSLTKNESTLLVHYGKESTQQMILVRLPEPKGDTK